MTLNKWLHACKFKIFRADPRLPTHLQLDGGKFQIPDDLHDKFLELYADELTHHNEETRWWSIHECATRYFALFFDLDLENKIDERNELSIDIIKKIARIIQAVVSQFFPSTKSEHKKNTHLIVLAAPPKFTNDTRKSGLHLVFPHVHVDLNQALQIRENVWRELSKQGNVVPNMTRSWEHVVDEQVYTGNAGLRMVGSHKWKICSTCKRQRQLQASCGDCMGRGGTNVNRRYMPFIELNYKGKSRKFQSRQWEWRDVVKMCSIRRPSVIENNMPFVVPKNAAHYPIKILYNTEPDSEVPSWINAIRAGKEKKVTEQGKLAPKNTEFTRRTKYQEDLTGDDTRVKLLETFIRQHCHWNYKHLQIDKVIRRERAPGYIEYLVNVSGDGSRFCQNVGRSHSRSSIYFYACNKGIMQKCFCRKSNENESYSNVPCHQFAASTTHWEEGQRSGIILHRYLFDSDTIESRLAMQKNIVPNVSSSSETEDDHMNQMLNLETVAMDKILSETHTGTLPRIKRKKTEFHSNSLNSLQMKLDSAKSKNDLPDDLKNMLT